MRQYKLGQSKDSMLKVGKWQSQSRLATGIALKAVLLPTGLPKRDVLYINSKGERVLWDAITGEVKTWKR